MTLFKQNYLNQQLLNPTCLESWNGSTSLWRI